MEAIMRCPACGSALKNIPGTALATCPACPGYETYPRVTWEIKQQVRKAEIAALPEASRIKCVGDRGQHWWRLSDRPGIFTHCLKGTAGSVRCRKEGGAVVYLRRETEAIERELIAAMGVDEWREAARHLFCVAEAGICCQAAKQWPWLAEREGDT